MKPQPRRYRIKKSLSSLYDHPPRIGSVGEVIEDFEGAGWVSLLFRLPTGDIRMTVNVAVLAERFEREEGNATERL